MNHLPTDKMSGVSLDILCIQCFVGIMTDEALLKMKAGGGVSYQSIVIVKDDHSCRDVEDAWLFHA